LEENRTKKLPRLPRLEESSSTSEASYRYIGSNSSETTTTNLTPIEQQRFQQVVDSIDTTMDQLVDSTSTTGTTGTTSRLQVPGIGSRSLEEIRELLNRDLPVEALKARPGKASQTFLYLKRSRVISMLNDIFGQFNYTTEVQDVQTQKVQLVDATGKPKFVFSVIAKGRITFFLNDGTQRWIQEYGYCTNEDWGVAVKGAGSDSFKRCVRNLGRYFGNLLDDDVYNTEKLREFKQLQESQRISSSNTGYRNPRGRR
jgi:hypothetical protein